MFTFALPKRNNGKGWIGKGEVLKEVE